MKLEIQPNTDAVARRGAELIASAARASIAARGRFVFAVSGGSTPWAMLRALANEDIPWDSIFIAQVDERFAPRGDPDRNLTHLMESLMPLTPLSPEQLIPMPVEDRPEEEAARAYARSIESVAGVPPIFDLVHLGLGADGHTASLIPNDPVLLVDNCDVATTSEYQGRRRMTLTYPILNRARDVLWLVNGQAKAAVLTRLLAGDPGIPAGRIRQDNATVIADSLAAGQLAM